MKIILNCSKLLKKRGKICRLRSKQIIYQINGSYWSNILDWSIDPIRGGSSDLVTDSVKSNPSFIQLYLHPIDLTQILKNSKWWGNVIGR